MTEIQFTATGNLTADPEIRYTPSGKAVANLTVAVTPRTRNAAGNWVDGETTFLRGAAWESLGENVASLPSGTRVNVTGILRSRTYDTKDGEKRTVLEATFESVSPDLRFATVKVTKASRGGGSSPAPAEADPWTGESATLTPEQYQARMQTLRVSLGATPVEPAF